MLATINNLITKKTFLSLLLCVIFFLAPMSASYTQSNGSAIQTLEGHVLMVSAQSLEQEMGADQMPGNAPTANGNVTGDTSVPSKIWEWFGKWLGVTVMVIPSAFLWVGGTLLDTSLDKLVFGMGSYVNNDVGVGKNLGIEISNAWRLIRDICNLAFIFGFVYIGIRTIIDPESASTKRFLSKIIIGALLINFSLFFVKFIVDFANFTAYQIYIAMVDTTRGGTLAMTVADRMGIITFFSSSGNPNAFAQITGPGTLWYFVLAGVFLFVVAFIFTAAALLLITRFVGIVLIMIGSPILFAATVFPQTEHYASEMWKKLISYAFFAPAFLLLILVSLTLINGFGVVPNGGNGFANAFTNVKTGANRIGFFGVVLNFVVITFFFIQSLIIAQKMGVAGGDAAVSMGNKIRGNVQSAIGGTARGAGGAVGNTALRYASRKARQFEMADNEHPEKEKTWSGKLGASKFGGFVKRTPLIGALQAAGNKASSDVAKRTGELKGLRNAQLKARLNTFVTGGEKTKWMNELDRLAVYNVFKDKGDIDELDPEQIRDYVALLKKNKMGTTSIDKLRMDTYSYDTSKGMSEIEKNVGKMKNASDIAALHKITVALSGEGADEKEEGKREKHVTEFVGALIRQSNGAMIEGLVRRKDEVTDAFMKQLLIDANAVESRSAEAIATHFDKLARESTDVGRRKRNESAAIYFRTAPAARALGLEEAVNTKSAGGGKNDAGKDDPEIPEYGF